MFSQFQTKLIDKRHKQLMLYLFCIYLITAAHHIYGAVIYNTPWRAHIAKQGLFWLALSIILLMLYSYFERKIAYTLFILISVFFFVFAIGIYEGTYNHLLKNILFFTILDESQFLKLYPPPLYEKPADFWFELSGIYSALISYIYAYKLLIYTRAMHIY
ncbi:MAG: hypothetical protein KDD94_00885 [Calditrichaeota bacterium]|nr:hypothetical protein [Calditrichota bacterium]